jgi:hypothetical protein
MSEAMPRRWATLIISGPKDPLPSAVRTWIAQALLYWQPGPAARAALVVEELVQEARTHGVPPHVLRLATGADCTTLYLVLDDRTPAGGTAWPSPASWTLLSGLSSRMLAEQYEGARAVCIELSFEARIPEVMPVAQPLPSPRRSDR